MTREDIKWIEEIAEEAGKSNVFIFNHLFVLTKIL